jgi:hypothetical protein
MVKQPTRAQLEQENERLREQLAVLARPGRSRSHSESAVSGPSTSRRSAPLTPQPPPPSPPPPSPPPPSPSPPPSSSPAPFQFPPLPPVPPLQPPADLKLDLPPEFDGKVSEYAAFIGHCEFYFDNKPSVFARNDGNKVSFAISRLRGRASTWAHTVRREAPHTPMFSSWAIFRTELDALFEDPFYIEQVRRDLGALRQTGSARTFSAEFKTLAAILHLSPEEKVFQYREKLKGPVQTQLAGALSPLDTFESIVYKAINIDQALFTVERAAKKAAKSQNPPPPPSSASRPQQSRSNAPSSHPGSSRGSGNSRPPAAHGGPPRTSSSIPYAPLSESEKQYREDNGLCRFCGGPHYKKDCDALKAKMKREAEKGNPPRYPASASAAHAHANPAPPVTVSHIISSAGKFLPQGH